MNVKMSDNKAANCSPDGAGTPNGDGVSSYSFGLPGRLQSFCWGHLKSYMFVYTLNLCDQYKYLFSLEECYN